MKRNDVVMAVDGYFYGRVWRVLPDGQIVVICSGSHVTFGPPENWEVQDYKGRRSLTGKWIPMTSLRELKKQAAVYNPHFGPYWNAWGKRWSKADTIRANSLLGIQNWFDEEFKNNV